MLCHTPLFEWLFFPPARDLANSAQPSWQPRSSATLRRGRASLPKALVVVAVRAPAMRVSLLLLASLALLWTGFLHDRRAPLQR